MRPFLCAPILALASLSPTAQDTAAPGFALGPAPYPGGSSLAATTTLSNGDVVVFDGTSVSQFASDGTLLHELGALSTFSFPSFVLADLDEQQVFFGESSTGGIYRLFLGVASAPDLVAFLPLNYDAAQASGDALYVSAATCGFGCGNEIWRVDLATGQTSLVARLPGASGPLAFDSAHDLYYGTASAQFPPPPKPSAVYRWSAAQLAGGLVLGLDDAQFVGGG